MIVGLTGGIGTGKSTVSKRLMEKGYPVVDTDLISGEVIKRKEIIDKICENIDKSLIENGEINRKKLGQIVFKDKNKLDILNSIMHPVIIDEMKKQIKKYSRLHNIVIADVPLLFEINMEKEFDAVILVYSKKEIQIKRIMNRDKRSEQEALDIINSQMDPELKRTKSDYILENNNSVEDLYIEIDKLLEKLEKNSRI